jgi:hypothetical protein
MFSRFTLPLSIHIEMAPAAYFSYCFNSSKNFFFNFPTGFSRLGLQKYK